MFLWDLPLHSLSPLPFVSLSASVFIFLPVLLASLQACFHHKHAGEDAEEGAGEPLQWPALPSPILTNSEGQGPERQGCCQVLCRGAWAPESE